MSTKDKRPDASLNGVRIMSQRVADRAKVPGSGLGRGLPEGDVVSAAKRMDKMTPRELLAVLTRMAEMFESGRTHARLMASTPRRGRAGAKRATKRRRIRARDRRLERNGWRAFHEEEKRRARAEA